MPLARTAFPAALPLPAALPKKYEALDTVALHPISGATIAGKLWVNANSIDAKGYFARGRFKFLLLLDTSGQIMSDTDE